ncbi:MAG: aminotransferase class V-fold PLP-dependent enzyme, partial [Gemmatimonadales bacterium]
PDDEQAWHFVKRQFPLRHDLVLMNAGNLCPSPYPVIDTVTSLTRDIDADASFQNRAKFNDLRERSRQALARYVRADPAEIAITRNTSEGNNTVINGLPLGAGDEVVIWDQNHPTNNIAWDVRAERYGYTVKRVSTPPSPSTAEELLMPFRNAITDRTRVLAFSHVSNISGVALPAKALCSLAQERGVLTLVDGAQVLGALRIDLHDMGCDFYTGSSHKWLVGPKEAGLLYVRQEQIDDLWPSDVGVGWAGALEHGAAKFENLGQRDDACVAAIGTAVEFHEALGPAAVEERVRALAGALKQGIRDRIPAAFFHTPLLPEISAGAVVFMIPSRDSRTLYEELYSEHAIAGAAMGGQFLGVRLCPHIYNTMDDVTRVVETLGRIR